MSVMEKLGTESETMDNIKITLIESFIFGIETNSSKLFKKIERLFEYIREVMHGTLKTIVDLKCNINFRWNKFIKGIIKRECVKNEVEMVDLASYSANIDGDDDESVEENTLKTNGNLSVEIINNKNTLMIKILNIPNQLRIALSTLVVEPLISNLNIFKNFVKSFIEGQE